MIYEGVEYKAWSDGKFRCPWKCGDPNYSQPKWATEKGFAGHLAKCKASPNANKAENWTPLPADPAKPHSTCPGCGKPIMTGQTIWVFERVAVCFNCAPGVSAGGYYDCAGLVIPDLMLEG